MAKRSRYLVHYSGPQEVRALAAKIFEPYKCAAISDDLVVIYGDVDETKLKQELNSLYELAQQKGEFFAARLDRENMLLGVTGGGWIHAFGFHRD